MGAGTFYFWLGASADADPDTHERSQSSLSSPSGECPLRNLVGYEIKPDFGYLSRLGGGNTQAFCDHEWRNFNPFDNHYPSGEWCPKCGKHRS